MQLKVWYPPYFYCQRKVNEDLAILISQPPALENLITATKMKFIFHLYSIWNKDVII